MEEEDTVNSIGESSEENLTFEGLYESGEDEDFQLTIKDLAHTCTYVPSCLMTHCSTTLQVIGTSPAMNLENCCLCLETPPSIFSQSSHSFPQFHQ